MSVINQMLKDLDGRQAEHSHTSTHTEALQVQNRNKNRLVLLVLSLILLVLIVIAWQLFAQRVQPKPEPLHKNKFSTVQPENTEIAIDNAAGTQTTAKEKDAFEHIAQAEVTKESPARNSQPSEPQLAEPLEKSTKVESVKEAPNLTKKITTKQASVATGKEQSTSESSKAENLSASDVAEAEKEEPALSISHKKMSPKDLVAQKMRRVEAHINEGNTKQAEALLEEVLLIDPKHIMARKQLAALWFGRQDFVAAHNLLSQGIALMPEYHDYRLMKARIYLKESKINQAVNTLMAMSHTESVEYQSVLATAAQQVKRHDVAKDAFKQLTVLEPTKGRWWLGLGTTFDSQGDFKQAKLAYRQALTVSNLSENAQQFIRQRLTILGD